MAIKTMSVSLVADHEYHTALKVLATKKGKGIGAIVREALDAKYGAEIEEILLFFREGDAEINHLMQNKSTRKRKSKGKKS